MLHHYNRIHILQITHLLSATPVILGYAKCISEKTVFYRHVRTKRLQPLVAPNS